MAAVDHFAAQEQARGRLTLTLAEAEGAAKRARVSWSLACARSGGEPSGAVIETERVLALADQTVSRLRAAREYA